jgi:type IV secretory pathway TraG/TraD family ATPase VirD4
MPSEEPDGELDLLRAPCEGACVVFSLNSSRYGPTARLLGNMAIQDLKAVCGLREERPDLARPALVAVDEFWGLAGDQIAGLFQRARSAGISLLMATQDLADLRRVDEGFDEQIGGKRTIAYVAAQAGHSAEECARTYLHLFDEHRDVDPADRVSAEDAIRVARVRTEYGT